MTPENSSHQRHNPAEEYQRGGLLRQQGRSPVQWLPPDPDSAHGDPEEGSHGEELFVRVAEA